MLHCTDLWKWCVEPLCEDNGTQMRRCVKLVCVCGGVFLWVLCKNWATVVMFGVFC